MCWSAAVWMPHRKRSGCAAHPVPAPRVESTVVGEAREARGKTARHQEARKERREKSDNQ